MRLIAILFFALSLSLSNLVFSAQVLKVKGQAILIDTAGDDIRMGQTYYLISKKKKRGIIKIIKLRPGKALAKLLKGKALADWTLRKRTTGAKKPAPAPRSKQIVRKKKSTPLSNTDDKLAIGFALGYNTNSSDVNFVEMPSTAARSDSYTGTSTSYEVLADYKIYKRFYLRGSLGIHNFNTEDSANTQCVSSDNISGAICKIDLGYMNLDIWLRYYLNQKTTYKFWAGAGLGILFSPSHNSTTALEKADLAATTLMQVGAGADIKISDQIYIPLWGEYGLYPSSDTVKMNSISVYFGLAYRL